MSWRPPGGLLDLLEALLEALGCLVDALGFEKQGWESSESMNS